jgi:hypothetical protein
MTVPSTSSISIPAFDAPAGGRLDDAMVAAYRSAGVLVLRNFVSRQDCER